MLDLLPVLSHTVSRCYLLFCCLEVNMRLLASAQKLLLKDKDPISAVCLHSWEYLQEYPLLLQALWHILAESCNCCFISTLVMRLFTKLLWSCLALLLTQHCFSLNQATSRSTVSSMCAYLEDWLCYYKQRKSAGAHSSCTKFQQTLCLPPSSL